MGWNESRYLGEVLWNGTNCNSSLLLAVAVLWHNIQSLDLRVCLFIPFYIRKTVIEWQSSNANNASLLIVMLKPIVMTWYVLVWQQYSVVQFRTMWLMPEYIYDLCMHHPSMVLRIWFSSEISMNLVFCAISTYDIFNISFMYVVSLHSLLISVSIYNQKMIIIIHGYSVFMMPCPPPNVIISGLEVSW